MTRVVIHKKIDRDECERRASSVGREGGNATAGVVISPDGKRFKCAPELLVDALAPHNAVEFAYHAPFVAEWGREG